MSRALKWIKWKVSEIITSSSKFGTSKFGTFKFGE